MATSAARWLTPQEQDSWRSFVNACHTFFAAVDAQLQRDSGMPLAYYEILVRLSEAPDRALRMSQLAQAAGASKSRTSHAVARLEARGWVRREDCPTDRRGQIAHLTDEGYAVLAAAAPGHVAQVRKLLLDVLTKEQVAELHSISTAMTTAAAASQSCGDSEGEGGSDEDEGGESEDCATAC